MRPTIHLARGHSRACTLADERGNCYTVSGFGFGMRIAQLSTIPADVFAGPHLGAILGMVQAGGGLGGAIGPFLGGWLFDLTGRYRLAFMAAVSRSRARPSRRGSRHGPRRARRTRSRDVLWHGKGERDPNPPGPARARCDERGPRWARQSWGREWGVLGSAERRGLGHGLCDGSGRG